MQRPPFQNSAHLPYSKWSQHRADNGLIYLSHPVTGEVKWLWSRHHDPKTEHDYLVNTVTGQRQWVTKENAHFCPVKAQPNSISTSAKPSQTAAKATSISAHQSVRTTSTIETMANSTRKKRPVNMPTAPAKVAAASNDTQSQSATSNYREIAAPKSLGLTADEALMLVPETGRRYIFNKKTKTSRWLPDRPPDTISSEKPQTSRFGRRKPSKQSSPSVVEDDDIDSDFRKQTEAPSLDGSSTTTSVISGGSAPGKAQWDKMHTSQTTAGHRTPVQPPSGETRINGRVGEGHDQAKAPPVGKLHDFRQPTTSNKEKRDEVAEKLHSLNVMIEDVNNLTTAGKYDMSQLRALANRGSAADQTAEGAQRLLELEEYLTQQMLKVDAVESEGNQMIRAKRKETVKTILSLTDEIEALRKKLREL